MDKHNMQDILFCPYLAYRYYEIHSKHANRKFLYDH